jgi:pimeloyl-ACP methyl ester carboxylesterase
MRKSLLGICTALLVPILALGTASSASAGGEPKPHEPDGQSRQHEPDGRSKRYEPGPIRWGTCADPVLRFVGAQCGTVKVPLNHLKPHGTKIKIAVSRVRHRVPESQYQGAILVNPGGPGGSGLIFSVLGLILPGAGPAYDWIGFDPRGVGASEPAVSCDPEYAGFNRPPYVPTSKRIEQAWFQRTRAYTRDCDRKNGRILDHLTTEDNAHDMEIIRQALGVKKISYYGFSYGTYLGQVYASLYAKRLHRVVFDSTVDPRRIWYQANLDQDPAFDRNLNIWFGWLARYDNVFGLGSSSAEVRRLFYATQSRLDRTPAEGTFGKIGGSEWNDTFVLAGYAQGNWDYLGQVFSLFVREGQVAPLELAYLSASGYGDDNGYAVYLGVSCTDARFPKSWAKWKRDNWRIYRKAPFFTWGNAWFNEPCRHWPARAQKPVRIRDRGVDSLLLINQTLDAATPYSGSLAVRRLFDNARLIAEPGGTTHSGSLDGNPCVFNRMIDYLLTGTLPRRVGGNRADVNCAPLPQPVPTALERRSKQQATDDQLRQRLIDQLSARPGGVSRPATS